MSALSKWQEYVDRYGRLENKIRQDIAKWRNFKKSVNKQKYENRIPDSKYDLLSRSPAHYLQNIEDSQIQLKFCELKIKFYKEIVKNGQTLSNLQTRNKLQQQIAVMLDQHEHILNNM